MFVSHFITKGMEADSDKRIIKGHITSDVVDNQNEMLVIDEVEKALVPYFKIHPAIIDFHSNRTVGKALSYKKSEIEGHPSIYIEAEIYKDDRVQLYDEVWDKLVKGDYRGFSLGGMTRDKEPVVKNGRLVMMLKSIEIYEISICPSGANPFAVIDYVSPLAKASGLEVKKREDGQEYLQCDGVVCELEKSEPEATLQFVKTGGKWRWMYCQDSVSKADQEAVANLVLEKFGVQNPGSSMEQNNSQPGKKRAGGGEKNNPLKTEDGMIKAETERLRLITLG